MKTKTKKTAVKTDAPVTAPVTVYVPAVRTPPVASPAAASPMDLLDNLMAGVDATQAPVKSKDRPELKLTPEATALYKQFIPTKQLFDIFDARLKNVRPNCVPISSPCTWRRCGRVNVSPLIPSWLFARRTGKWIWKVSTLFRPSLRRIMSS